MVIKHRIKRYQDSKYPIVIELTDNRSRAKVWANIVANIRVRKYSATSAYSRMSWLIASLRQGPLTTIVRNDIEIVFCRNRSSYAD